MSESHSVRKYERKITPIERLLTRSPYATVTMAARIRGSVSKGMLRGALAKVRLRHPNLRVRIIEDKDSQPWFTSEGAGEIPIEVVPRESEDHWIRVVQESCQIPYEFEARPAVRFVLVQSPTISELVILCHHILCDGLSLAYLARDLMVHLGDPDREVEALPDPVPIALDSLPEDVSASSIVRFFINRMNKKWAAEKVLFDQEDYMALSQAYWMNYQHQMLPVELSKAETTALVQRCREEEVTVNSALTAAFAGAQKLVLGEEGYHPSMSVAANLRDRVQPPAGEVMGFYAAAVGLKHQYKPDRGFWDNTRRIHRKVQPLFTNKQLFENALAWRYLEPSMLEALPFKILGRLVPEDASRYKKLSTFAARDDVIRSMIKREKMDSLDRVTVGTTVTNLGQLDFPSSYGALELERLIMKPGGAFPLVNFNLVLGAATAAGRLSLLVEYVEDNVDGPTMSKIAEGAMGFLLGA